MIFYTLTVYGFLQSPLTNKTIPNFQYFFRYEKLFGVA